MEQERLKRACRELAKQVGTPGFRPALSRFYEALAAAEKPGSETRQ